MTRRLVYRGSLDGTGQILRRFPVAANQTIHRGDIVVLDTGKAKVAASNPTSGTVLGVSDSDIVTGANPGADETIFVDINPKSIFVAPYKGSATPAIGTKYALGDTPYQFDADTTTNGFMQVVGNVDTGAKVADVLVTSRVFTGN